MKPKKNETIKLKGRHSNKKLNSEKSDHEKLVNTGLCKHELSSEPMNRQNEDNEDPKYLRGFVIMPFGSEKDESKVPRKIQDLLFHLLIFAVNDAYYQNYVNAAIRNWTPIRLERADIGAGRSTDLLDNVLRRIDKSDFCLIDYTYDNLNVALECGYAMANNKYLIPICQENMKGESETRQSRMSKISDLAGKLMHYISLRKISELKNLDDILPKISLHDFLITHHKMFNVAVKNKQIHPFNDEKDKVKTFFRHYLTSLEVPIENIEQLESIYREDIVRQIYSAFRPLSEKLESGAIEAEFLCTAYATREAAKLSEAFGNAKEHIRILTTNLKGLLGYIEDIIKAMEKHKKLEVEILTLNPDSEFVNFRGQLIGREIARFREEMKDSLKEFKKKLITEKLKNNISIKTYSEFPTQITFFIDDFVYSSVVSVNHQSRYNLLFKVKDYRKGVAESFSQHWDTIWARATDVGQ